MKTHTTHLIDTYRPPLSALAITIAALTLASTTPHAQDAAAGFETVPPGATAELVGADLQSGPHHRVQAEAAPWLFDYNYAIDSDFGPFTAHGTKGLAKRVNEINAIAALREMKTTKTFSDAAGKAALSPLITAKDLVTKPGETTKGVVKGVVETGKGAVSGVAGGVKSLVSGKKQQKTEYEGGTVGELSGLSKMKRGLAVKLEVDPYTRNELFQEELDDVARTAFLGDLSTGVLTTLFTGGLAKTAITVGSASTDLRAAIVDMSPSEIRTMNRKKLESLSVSDESIDAFLNNTQFLPSQQALLVQTAATFQETTGMESLIALASRTPDEFETIRVLRTSEMLAALHAGGTGIVQLVDCQGLVAGLTTDGELIVPISGRLLAWTPLAGRIAEALGTFQTPDNSISQRQLLYLGTVTPKAREEFTARGVNIRGEG